jgi:phospholipid/cholesterol/gamma-HCH transport system substrate-binding protein
VSRSLTRLQAVLLGLAVLVGLGAGIGGLFAIGGQYWPWSNTFHVRAGFPRIRGVEIGTRVRIQGIDAGEVETVTPPELPGGNVVLGLRLKGELRHLVRANAVAQIQSEGMVGGKIVELIPGNAPEAVTDNALIGSLPSADLNETLAQVGGALQDIRDGEGTVSKLLKDPAVFDAVVSLAKQSEKTMSSVQQDAEAMKRLPFVGGYVEDPRELLVRPNCERNQLVFAENDLFEPGRAVLTARGRQKLDEKAGWVNGFRQKGVEIVVVSYADPKGPNPDLALNLTRQQSDAVVTYLKDKHGVHKLSGLQGFVYTRKVTPLGMGVKPPPLPEAEPLPASRVEVLVFVPQG